MNELIQIAGVAGTMALVFLLAMFRMEAAYNARASRLEISEQARIKSDNEFRYAQLEMFRSLLTEMQKQRETEAINRADDVKRNEENFAQYESLVASIAANHTLLAQNQNNSLALLNDMRSLLTVDAAAMQRVEIKQQASSEVLDKHTMTLEEIVRQLGDVMRTLNSLETQITNLSTSVATKQEIAGIQRQIQELKLEVASLAKAIAALQVGKQDKNE